MNSPSELACYFFWFHFSLVVVATYIFILLYMNLYVLKVLTQWKVSYLEHSLQSEVFFSCLVYYCLYFLSLVGESPLHFPAVDLSTTLSIYLLRFLGWFYSHGRLKNTSTDREMSQITFIDTLRSIMRVEIHLAVTTLTIMIPLTMTHNEVHVNSAIYSVPISQ